MMMHISEVNKIASLANVSKFTDQFITADLEQPTYVLGITKCVLKYEYC